MDGDGHVFVFGSLFCFTELGVGEDSSIEAGLEGVMVGEEVAEYITVNVTVEVIAVLATNITSVIDTLSVRGRAGTLFPIMTVSASFLASAISCSL